MTDVPKEGVLSCSYTPKERARCEICGLRGRSKAGLAVKFMVVRPREDRPGERWSPKQAGVTGVCEECDGTDLAWQEVIRRHRLEMDRDQAKRLGVSLEALWAARQKKAAIEAEKQRAAAQAPKLSASQEARDHLLEHDNFLADLANTLHEEAPKQPKCSKSHQDFLKELDAMLEQGTLLRAS